MDSSQNRDEHLSVISKVSGPATISVIPGCRRPGFSNFSYSWLLSSFRLLVFDVTPTARTLTTCTASTSVRLVLEICPKSSIIILTTSENCALRYVTTRYLPVEHLSVIPKGVRGNGNFQLFLGCRRSGGGAFSNFWTSSGTSRLSS